MSSQPNRKILRHRLEKQLAKQQEEKRKELLRKRIEIAKEGVALYKGGQIIGAMRLYSQYILILEMWKKTGKGGLGPEHFDSKKDLFETVLISGIFWDFSRLYDKSKRPDQRADLKYYLQKYVAFSKGFPYQPLAKEALRRYLNSGRCQHTEDFKWAYKQLGGESCFIAHALIYELEWRDIESLLSFRDHVLAHRSWGRGLIRSYYLVSPPIAKRIETWPRPMRQVLAQMLVRPIAQWSNRWD
ncbi:MAG: hypothetical protein EOP09_12840, partial [Proteobacteria bacterium]